MLFKLLFSPYHHLFLAVIISMSLKNFKLETQMFLFIVCMVGILLCFYWIRRFGNPFFCLSFVFLHSNMGKWVGMSGSKLFKDWLCFVFLSENLGWVESKVDKNILKDKWCIVYLTTIHHFFTTVWNWRPNITKSW